MQILRVIPFNALSSYKTTLKQQLNGEKLWKWDGELSLRPVSGWAMCLCAVLGRIFVLETKTN